MRRKKKRISFITPYQSGHEIVCVKDAMKSNWIAPLGPYVDLFEEKLKEYTKAKSCVVVNSGTSAIHLALKLIGIGKEDVVLCNDLTFIASANPIIYEGATPVFIDADAKNLGMSVNHLEKALKEKGSKVKAVVVTHLYGVSSDMFAIKSLCDKFNVPIVEDACETLGSTYGGIMTGLIGDYGCYSFNGNKLITTSGGGALVSREKDLDKALKFATQHRDSKIEYLHNEIGYNYRLSNISASIGVAQLHTINERIEMKKNIFKKYNDAFACEDKIKIVDVPFGSTSNHWVTIAILSDMKAKQFVERLDKEFNIESRLLWKPLHTQPVFEGSEYYGSGVSDLLYEFGVCLPSDINMKNKDIDRVIKSIRSVIR